MLYKYFKGWDAGRNPIYEWGCDCEECRTKSGPCMALIEAMNEEEQSSQAVRFLKESYLQED